MALNTTKKAKIIKEIATHEKDTGSVDVQIALLSETMDKLVSHLKRHPQDVHSKRGLIKMVIKRKKLLADLKKTDEKRYSAVVKKIGLKK
jgi:small subunit ribosomal protein S15